MRWTSILMYVFVNKGGLFIGNPLLAIENLRTSFRINERYYPAVDDVTIEIKENEVLAIVGESGSGKSALALSLIQLHDAAATKVEGQVHFQGEDLLTLSRRRLNKVRGAEIGMIFQDPMTALNPLSTIGSQIEESMKIHMKYSAGERKMRALELIRRVGIQDEMRVYSQYPHEISGGMRQRIVIAIAIACHPVLLIADEPTTALDVTIQAQIMDLLKQLQLEINTGILLITHDLGVVAEMADRVAVMYAGEIVEMAYVNDIFEKPLHPYTRSLFKSVPSAKSAKKRLHIIEGTVPAIHKIDRNGCRFASRIPWIHADQHEKNPTLKEIMPNHFVRCTCYKRFHFN